MESEDEKIALDTIKFLMIRNTALKN